MARPTVTTSSLAIWVWLTSWSWRRLRANFKLRITENTWTLTRRNQKLKLTTDRTAQGHHGVVRTVSVAGCATVVVTPVAKQDGTNNGVHRCAGRWIICAMR